MDAKSSDYLLLANRSSQKLELIRTSQHYILNILTPPITCEPELQEPRLYPEVDEPRACTWATAEVGSDVEI